MAEFDDNQYWDYPHFHHLHPVHRPMPSISTVGDDSEYDAFVLSSMGEGPKGDKGDSTYFDDLTDEQLAKIYQNASFVGNKSYDAVVTTAGTSTSNITIPFDYDDFDMLFVDVNGLDLSEHDDYEISGDKIILTTPLPAGQDVHFRALKYDLIDGDKNIVNAMGRKDYNTVAEMQADMELEPGDICHTLGFHVAGDGGAAWYKIKAHGVANGIDILDLENDCVAFLQITGDYVTPEMFGAWGDGEHDDAQALKAAFSDCDNINLIGKYAISEPINVHGIVLGKNDCLVTAYDKAVRMPAFFVHAGALIIQNVTFDCSCSIPYVEADYPNLYNVAILSNTINYKLIIKSCTFNNVYTSAISMYRCSNEIVIDGCNFNPGSGNSSIADYIRLATSNGNYIFSVRNCTFVGLFNSINNYCGIYMATINARKEIVIENNTFDGLSRYGSHRLAAIDCYGLVYNIKIRNNNITNCAWNAIRLHTCSGSEVSGNYITMDATRERLTEYAILVSNANIDEEVFDFDSVVIKNNHIECIGNYEQQFAINVYTGNNNSKINSCEIIGNSISGSFIRGIDLHAAVALIDISNNVINVGDNGIRINQDDYTNVRLIINNNIIVAGEVIYYRDTGSGNIEISSNNLKSKTGYCINASSTAAIILNNLITGFVGINGGKYVGFNNIHDLSGTVKITGVTTQFMNYYNGTVI